MIQIIDDDCKKWILEIKSKIRSAQMKTVLSVNAALIEFYWDLGEMISQKQAVSSWGSKLIEQVANDLKDDFPELKGLSNSNLKYCKRFYEYYKDKVVRHGVEQIGQQAVDQFEIDLLKQIPWGHNILIFTKSKDAGEALFYIQKTIENDWGRETLALQIKSQLFDGKEKQSPISKQLCPNRCPIWHSKH
jgi:predicted nuclease of restriction endonuclease-like (RecB) superfamily